MRYLEASRAQRTEQELREEEEDRRRRSTGVVMVSPMAVPGQITVNKPAEEVKLPDPTPSRQGARENLRDSGAAG